jgi:hypothetical protein
MSGRGTGDSETKVVIRAVARHLEEGMSFGSFQQPLDPFHEPLRR